ncbi:MAG: DUF1549 and DUF1553 domain-containing protein [Gemmataceae bacterium]
MTPRRSSLAALFAIALALPAASPPVTPPPATTASTPVHWSFRPPVRRLPPAVREAAAARNPIDRFLLARLEAGRLHFSAPADRITLLRRLSYDLVGLPPTPEEIDAFVADRSLDAYEKQVERLLASPSYGERWAQVWLDVARFAETNGYEADGERPHAWRYRDWVVRAWNEDLPFDAFVTRQLAGDLLAPGHPEAAQLRIAAGFNRCGPIHQVAGNVDPLEIRHELLNEMTSSVGSAFLGLTLGCARCHDHKFDPVSQKDYFQIEAFFAAAQPREVNLASAGEKAAYAKDLALLQTRLLPLRNQVAAIDAPYRKRIGEAKRAQLEAPYREALAIDPKKRTPAQQKLADQAAVLAKVTWDEVVAALSEADREKRAALRAKIHELEARSPLLPASAWTVEESSKAPATHILKRGNIHRPGKQVEPAFPDALGAGSAEPKNRLGLARWLMRPDHPLTARVLVNRLWLHHFGQGLVRTPNDFGIKGEAPSHPDLLDWLALEFIDSGWSIKHLHRLMVLSTAYQQSSAPTNEQARKADPENRLLWRMNRRRLTAESLRDGMLATTGSLTNWVGGPMIRVPLEPEVYDLIFTEGEPDGLWLTTPDEREHQRRSIYLFNKRNVRLPLLEAFDQPDTLSSCPIRPVSTFAPQALILMNGPFAQEQAQAFAARLWRDAGSDAGAQIDRAYRLALGRLPRQEERGAAQRFLTEQTELLTDRLRLRQPVALPEGLPPGVDLARGAALADFCLALLNRNAFVYVD